MHQPNGFLRKKELIAIFGIALFLTGFVGFLLASNYRSLQKLRDSAQKQYEYEFEQRGWSLEHFLENQRQKVTSIANTGKLDLYFENKALGMSMQYGLRSNLLSLALELSQFVRQQQIGDKYGPFDMAFIETGAYNEKWHHIHMFPEETVQANIDLGSQILHPIHWATFNLSLHTWYDPMNRLTFAAESLGVTTATPVVGETTILGEYIPQNKWWLNFIVGKE